MKITDNLICKNTEELENYGFKYSNMIYAWVYKDLLWKNIIHVHDDGSIEFFEGTRGSNPINTLITYLTEIKVFEKINPVPDFVIKHFYEGKHKGIFQFSLEQTDIGDGLYIECDSDGNFSIGYEGMYENIESEFSIPESAIKIIVEEYLENRRK